ncbi:FecR/PupR family sigma factor regulator [Variovorax sp. ZS18.2.2]|uniref:FecR/PupR family sigma factor regulator n=1 Tax=Variovorax sp. ZS18.2.2 TaxID=2971255 RepID=UPI002150CBF7|nr:FecR/PupR family sigma factor regulator [Variovorax sp. ZS18.2.2]MCR6476352.1 FecR/PupR family sigma factor regulator [Variovorax sp. ZS18.2.2]
MPHDERPRDARSDDACLGEALDWIVRLNRLRASDREVRALAIWCARSAAHARAWREAMALWALLLPAARECFPTQHRRGAAPRPRIAHAAGDIRFPHRSAAPGAAPDTSSSSQSSHLRPRHSWS